MARFVITGTGTDSGKTVFAAGSGRLPISDDAKPVQSRLAGNVSIKAPSATNAPAVQPGGDRAEVDRLSGAKPHPDAVVLREPLSPHRAAALDRARIDPDALTPPPAARLVTRGRGVS